MTRTTEIKKDSGAEAAQPVAEAHDAAGLVVKIEELTEGMAPAYASAGAAALDVRNAGATIVLTQGRRELVMCGFRMELPPGHAALMLPRSGLALRHGVTLVNAPGLIDEDYRGEVCALLTKLPSTNVEAGVPIQHGDRIAQLLIIPVSHPLVEVVSELSETERGEGGFGSTGVE